MLHPRPAAVPLPDDLRNRLGAHIRRLGERGVVEESGLSRPVIARAMAGFSLRRGTVLAIAAAIETLDAGSAPESR